MGRWSAIAANIEGEETTTEPAKGRWSKFRSEDPALVEKAQEQLHPDYETASAKTVASEALKNVPGSLVQLGKDVVGLVEHPIEAAKGVGKIALGAGELFVPGEQGHEKYAKDFVKQQMDKYSSKAKIKKTLAETPAEFATDLGTLLLPGGTAAKGVGATLKKAKTGGKAGTLVRGAGKAIEKAGEITAETGALLDPTTATISGVKAATKAGAHAVGKVGLSPQKIMPRIDKAKPRGEQLTEINTLLGARSTFTPKGLSRINKGITDMNARIDNMVDTLTKTGVTRPLTELFDGLQKIRDKEFTLSDKKAVDKVVNDYLKGRAEGVELSPGATKLIQATKAALSKDPKMLRQVIEMEMMAKVMENPMTPKDLQTLKKGIYSKTASHYGSANHTPTKTEVLHRIARNAKETLEDLIPGVEGFVGIKDLNKAEGNLLQVRELVYAGIVNAQGAGTAGKALKRGAVAAAGGSIIGPKGAAAAGTFNWFSTDVMRSRLAILAKDMQDQGITINKAVPAVSLGLIQLGRNGEVLVPEQPQ